MTGATDEYLYFTWQEDDGDIWVMDVVPNEEFRVEKVEAARKGGPRG